MQMMKCGHTANAHTSDKKPVCVICYGNNSEAEVVVDPPDLKDRMAECPDCYKKTPSLLNLAFFDYRGPGSDWEKCKCERFKIFHNRPDSRNWDACEKFDSTGQYPLDSYYCGCRGWN